MFTSRRFNTLFTLFFISGMVSWSVVNGTTAKSGETALREKITFFAKRHLDTRYRYGGIGKEGFDCSGFVKYVYSSQGINLPRTSLAQYRAGRAVQFKDALPGDLLFFAIDRKCVSHVGIFLGEKKFIHAPRTGKSISISSLDNTYWKDRFVGSASYIHLYEGGKK